MLITAIKKVIPLSVKVRLKSMLVSPDAPGGAVDATRKSRSRPCASKWPASVCECEMHLGAFRQERIQARLLFLLKEAGIEYVDDVGDESAHLAVDIATIPQVQSLLDSHGLMYEAVERDTEINEYDFPDTKSGVSLSSLVSKICCQITVQPIYFCKARWRDANDFSVLITTFNDAGGARLFHSRQAKTRALALSEPRSAVSVRQVSDPIDFVITTVDGSDPRWRAKFNELMASRDAEPALAKASNAARYTTHDELRFVLRSIHYYAPYIRTIHIVTDDQSPGWLDTEHPKINLVDHKDIIDPQYLPTFNSDAIESFLWKISGLSERFVYFNDDMLLMGPTSELTFYTSHGLPRFYASPRRIPSLPPEWADSYTTHAHLQTASALEKRGYDRPTRKYRHAPYVARKSILQAIESEFSGELHRTRCSRIRSEDSFATISFLYPNYALATQKGVLSPVSYQYIDISSDDWKERLLRVCRRTDITFACVNESHDALDDGSLEDFISGILSSRFPCVAPWENDSFRLRTGGA